MNNKIEEIYVVHVTKLCNCNCKYCYEQDKTSTYTKEEVLNTVKDIVAHRTSNSFNIEFLGGEPMLAWDNIKAVIQYFKEYKESDLHVNFTITTNGTIINDELIEYLKNYPINFAISLDGHPFANQFRTFKSNGENTYDKVVENIKILLENNYRPSVHITTHTWNIGYLFDSLIHLMKLGIYSFGIGTVESTQKFGVEYEDEFLYQLDKFSNFICTNNIEKYIHVDLFDYIKPKEDVRSYIRDVSGKVIAESYGRSGNDISHCDDKYNIMRCDNDNELSNRIYKLRSSVYKMHHNRLKSLGKE